MTSPFYVILTQMAILASGIATTALFIYIVNLLNVVVFSRITRSVFILIFSNLLLFALLSFGQLHFLDWLSSWFVTGGFGFAFLFAIVMCTLGGLFGSIVTVYMHFRRLRHANSRR